jgi:hypothetical protein
LTGKHLDDAKYMTLETFDNEKTSVIPRIFLYPTLWLKKQELQGSFENSIVPAFLGISRIVLTGMNQARQ